MHNIIFRMHEHLIITHENEKWKVESKKKTWINNKINQKINLKNLFFLFLFESDDNNNRMNPFLSSEANNNFVFFSLTHIVDCRTIIKYSVNIVWVEKCQRINLRMNKISNIISWLYYAWNVEASTATFTWIFLARTMKK